MADPFNIPFELACSIAGNHQGAGGERGGHPAHYLLLRLLLLFVLTLTQQKSLNQRGELTFCQGLTIDQL